MLPDDRCAAFCTLTDPPPFWVQERPDLFEAALAEPASASSCRRRMSPELIRLAGNPIIFAVGPLVGLFPSRQDVAMFKSPHTGNLGGSHAGGRSAIAIREAVTARSSFAGLARCRLPGRGCDHVHFVTPPRCGLHSSYTVGSVLRERESGSTPRGVRTILRIGRAGERQVTYAQRIAGPIAIWAAGAGAVFGASAQGVSDRRAPFNCPWRPQKPTGPFTDESGSRDRIAADEKVSRAGTAINVLR